MEETVVSTPDPLAVMTDEKTYMHRVSRSNHKNGSTTMSTASTTSTTTTSTSPRTSSPASSASSNTIASAIHDRSNNSPTTRVLSLRRRHRHSNRRTQSAFKATEQHSFLPPQLTGLRSSSSPVIAPAATLFDHLASSSSRTGTGTSASTTSTSTSTTTPRSLKRSTAIIDHTDQVTMAMADTSSYTSRDTHTKGASSIASYSASDTDGLAMTIPATYTTNLGGMMTTSAPVIDDACSEVSQCDRDPLPEVSGSPWLADGADDPVATPTHEDPTSRLSNQHYRWTSESQLRRFRRKLYLRTRNFLIGSDPLEIGPTKFVRQQVVRSLMFFIPIMTLVHFVLFTNSFYLIFYELVICMVAASFLSFIRRCRAACNRLILTTPTKNSSNSNNNNSSNPSPTTTTTGAKMTRQNSQQSVQNRLSGKRRETRPVIVVDQKSKATINPSTTPTPTNNATTSANSTTTWWHFIGNWTSWHPFRFIPSSSETIPIVFMLTFTLWTLEVQHDLIGFGMLAMLVAPITMTIIGPWASLVTTIILMGESIWFYQRFQLELSQKVNFLDLDTINDQYTATINLMMNGNRGSCPNLLLVRNSLTAFYPDIVESVLFYKSSKALLHRSLWMLFLSWSSAVIVLFTHRRCYRRLIRAYRQAKNAAREKSRLVSQVAHELRTPLSAVLGWTELLLTEADADLGGIGIELGSVHEAQVAEKFRQNSEHLDALEMRLQPATNTNHDTILPHVANDDPKPPFSWPRRNTTMALQTLSTPATAPAPAPATTTTTTTTTVAPIAPAPMATIPVTTVDDTAIYTNHANAATQHVSVEASRTDSLRLVHTASRHLMCILNDILDVGKLGAGKMSLIYEDFDFHSLVVDTCHIMSGLSAKKGLEMILEYPRNVPTLFRGDSGRIRQILSNLISNAIKYTEQGYIRVSIKEEGYTENGLARLLCEVDDSGVGIPESLQNKLFAEFSQCGFNGEGPTPTGTGLGLFLVKQLTELMGGSVNFRSSLGIGSTFGFRIPLEQRNPPPISPGQLPHPDSMSSFHTAASASGPLGFLPSFLQDCLTPGGTRTYGNFDAGLQHCAFYIFSRGQHFRRYLENLCTESWHADSCTILHESRTNLGQTHVAIPSQKSNDHRASSRANNDDSKNVVVAPILPQERRGRSGRRSKRSIFLIDLGNSPGTRHDRQHYGACTPTSSTAVCALSIHSIDTELDTDDLLEAIQRSLLQRASAQANQTINDSDDDDDDSDDDDDDDNNGVDTAEERDTVVLLYSFGQASRVTVPPQLAAVYDVSVCRKPVTERELLMLVRRPLSYARQHTEGFVKNIPKRTLSPSRLQIPVHRLRSRFEDQDQGHSDHCHSLATDTGNVAAIDDESHIASNGDTSPQVAPSLTASPLSPTSNHLLVDESTERDAHHTTDDSVTTTTGTAITAATTIHDEDRTNGEFTLSQTLHQPPFDELRTRLQQQILTDSSDSDMRSSADAFNDVVAWMSDLVEPPTAANTNNSNNSNDRDTLVASADSNTNSDPTTPNYMTTDKDASRKEAYNSNYSKSSIQQKEHVENAQNQQQHSPIAASTMTNGNHHHHRHTSSSNAINNIATSTATATKFANVPMPSRMVNPVSNTLRNVRYQGRVLVVDDNSINRSLLTRQLELLGVQTIESAANGEEACAKFQPGHYHLILMDVRMPRMDGYTAARVMREKESSFIHDTASVIPVSSTNHPNYSDTTIGTNANHNNGDMLAINEKSTAISSPNHHCRCVGSNYRHNRCNCHVLRSTPITTSSASSNVNSATASPSRAPQLRAAIVALTADRQLATGEGRLQITRCGMDDVLIKPINLPGLTALLHAWLPSTHT
ncbi:hypothetical protein BDF22DRAFT_742021 [Syncephalis plumigaleata]|nr:hypothetical protein BDF22DRAFT_742021 [Syncephalis plumigaleata]